ncbi:MAG: carboxypeptidase regulatory-like domain-containing protein [Pirellulaceae bacterium]|nr:carboxypeptidase regulatory-like domain-containing protein [Pirellulaceae bacterium]
MAEPIGLMEKYALSEDRETMLSELIPGSEDYYFYHCLHFQTVGQVERSEAIIKDWLAEHNGRETPVIQGMLDRQRLLTYNQSPQRTIDYLVKRLGVQLNHAQPVVKGERRFPSTLNVDQLDVDRLVKEALQRNDALKPVGMAFLAELFRTGKTAGVSINLYEFLKRVDGPYIERLDELVIKELKSRNEKNKRFGDLAAHNYLTLAELDRVAAQVPQVADDNTFVSAKLRRMRPDGDSDPSQQPEVRRSYLQRIEAYVRTLPQSYNSLKASASYRLLESNLAAGIYDRDLFMRYLQLPRNSPIIHIEWARRPIQKANLGENFMDMALLSPIGDEQSLVRTYLEHFLQDANDTTALEQYLRPEYLRRVFAETKLMAGIGDEQQWYRMLSASERQAIRDSIELRLAPQNKIFFDADDPSQLIVDVKNIDELVVRIYEINSLSYYRSNKKPVNTDIDLDGLVATHEQKYSYNQPAVERHRETIALDQVGNRGVWIVDLVGKGVRARAMIRRGEIHHVASTVADGMLFTIVNEDREPVPGATMLVGSHELVADEDGRIVLPPVANEVSRRAIISDGQVAQSIDFRHLRERYNLSAGMHIDRTVLQSGGNGKVLIRPRVTMGNQIIDPATLQDVSVLIHATDLENLSTTVQLEKLELDQNLELVVPFRVPARLANLSVTLSGKIDGLADGRLGSLQTSRSWDIAGIRRTNHTHDLFLTRDNDDFVIAVRGRTGEPIAGATVAVSLQTQARNANVEQTLQSDDDGYVRLGSLPGVTKIHYSIPSGMHHERDLRLDRVIWPSELHTTTARPIRLPLAQSIDQPEQRYRLLEIRGGNYHADQTDSLSIDAGLLNIKPLAAGDYHLVDRIDGSRLQIVVVDGPVHSLVVAGKVRHRSISPSKPLGIASIDRNDKGLKVKLSGDARFARVHIYASRYLDSTDPITQLRLPTPRLFGRSVSIPRSGYVSDLRLGDEYQYVLRRRYANKYPGVMLPQPSVILNPWETEKTTNTTQSARAGDAPPPSRAAASAAPSESAAKDSERQAQVESSDFDFLADPGVLLSNLIPDKNGVVTIASDLIDGMPLLQIVISDPATLLQRTMAAELEPAESVDLRLAQALNAHKPLSFERAVAIVSKDDPLDLSSLGSAQIQVYGNVGALMKLYKTLVNDPRLNDFDELASWHEMEQDDKLDAYSRLAGHELHLFLWSHDPTFFADVVRPYLENKKEKQFLDHWLLESDLSQYTRLWQYNQLNAAERALLAIAVPDVRESIRRELTEIVAKQDENHQMVRQQIESALATGGLNFGDSDGDDAMDMMFGLQMPSAVSGKKLDSDVAGENWQELSRRRLQLGRRSESDRNQKAKRLYEENEKLLAERDEQSGDDLFRGRMSGAGGMGGGFGGGAYGFYQELDTTKQWAESNWDQVRIVGGPAPSTLIPVNPFWADLANHDRIGNDRNGNDEGQSPRRHFALSTHLLRPVDNRHSVLTALAMCGLPLKSGDIGLPEDNSTPYAPEHAVAVVTKRLNELQAADGESSILVGQRFAPVHQRTSNQDAPEEPKEFLTGIAYRGQTVVSNPTSERKIVDIFWQIPAGSLPLGGSQTTDSRSVTLEPFAVQAIEYQFYFPMPGEFKHYPATVASDQKLLARGSEKTFTVVDEETEDDRITWEKMARSGTPQQIKDFLAEANLRDLDWMLVAHRMQDQNVYQAVIGVLDDANLPINDLWAYSLHHRDESAMQQYLALRSGLVQRVGPVLNSPLLTVDPIERRTYELLEYAPLIRARIHRLGDENEILNSTFLAQYRNFVQMIGFSQETPPDERLVLTYYLLLQNRIQEAIETFSNIDRESVTTQLQYDYVRAYLAMHNEAYDEAERIAGQYVDLLIPRWKNRFASLTQQLQQRKSLMQTEQLVSVEPKDGGKPIAEGSGDLAVMDRERRQAIATDQQPEVIVTVEGDSLRIDHRRAKQVTLNLYGVDLELLFSKAPFVREDLQRMAMVKPMRSDTIQFDDATGVGKFQLDADLRRQTLLVEVVAGASRSTALYYGGEITTYVSESYGQLQTTDAKTHRPVSTAYVKIYARYPDGSVKFYKDGYTDARGRFDYTSISAVEARGANRFAILVMSAEKGATLHDVASPTQ